MNEYENNDFNPEQPPRTSSQPPQQEGPQQQVPPQQPYYNPAANRKESPYAGSPYVMNHQTGNTGYTYQPPRQEYAYQYQPPYEPPKSKKQKKPGAGRRVLSVVLTLALVAGSCGLTAGLVNSRWQKKTERMETSFNQKLTDLEKKIGTAKNDAIISGAPAGSGNLMSPAQVYAANVSSVVTINATIQVQSYYGIQEGSSSGSGFILTEDGYVITNCHVVEDATAVTVSTYDGSEYEASVVGKDAMNDIAVLKVEATGLPAVTVGSSDELNIGDMVTAIGNPLGMLSSTQTVGYVSGKDRDITTDGSIISMIQTDAAINSGNSGGPLFNMRGEVVGVTSAKYSGTSTSGASIEGISFAIPIDDVKGIIEDLIDHGYVTGAYLGVTVSNTDEEAAAMFGLPLGAYVMTVEESSCADKAGIQPKDIIVDLGGYEVTGITTLTRSLRNFEPGATTTITVIRSGGEKVLDITLDEKPQAMNEPEAVPETQPAPSQTNPDQMTPDEFFDEFRRIFGW